ncbi:MAG: hypothetical protein AB7I19_12555 [Planctomycetota bacterium]
MKVAFVYPESNPRVLEAHTALEHQLQRASPSGAPIPLECTQHGLSVFGSEIDPNRPFNAWLRERLLRARIAGLSIAPGVDPAVLSAFGAALRQSYAPGSAPLSDGWTLSGYGIEPIVAGGAPMRPPHAALADRQPTRVAMPTAMGSVASEASGGPIDRRAVLDSVIRSLSSSQGARTALAEMQRKIEFEYGGGITLDFTGMIQAMVGELPESLVVTPNLAAQEVEEVIAALASQIDGFLLARPEDPAARLTVMAATVARRRQVLPPPTRPARTPSPGSSGAPTSPQALPSRAPLPQSAPTPRLDAAAVPETTTRWPTSAASITPLSAMTGAGRSDDSFESFLEGVRNDLSARPQSVPDNAVTVSSRGLDGVEDRIDLLVDDVQSLPDRPVIELNRDDAAVTDASLGASLHLLTYSRESSRIVDAVAMHIDAVLRSPTASQKRILTRWLRFAREGGPNGTQDEPNQRLFGFLQRNGIGQMMSAREGLEVDQVVQTFPTQFIAFLDGLDVKDPRSEQSFTELWDKVGADSMNEAARVLIEDGSLLTPNRTEKILKLGGRRAAIIARHYVGSGAAWTRMQVVNFLRRQSLPRQEAAALSIVQPITTFPSAYLADLCECVARGKGNMKLHGYTSLLLRQYIRDTAERPAELDRRLYAIRALAHWASPETVQCLEQLAKEGRLLAQTKEARAVRQAAAETLRVIREGGQSTG